MKFLSLTPIALLQATLFTALHGARWTYSGLNGQQEWDKHYPYCGGAFQSPIDIRSNLLRFDPKLYPVEVENYNLSPNQQLTLGNNGHSLQLSLPSTMYISSLPHCYTAAQLHFHWGSSGWPEGSEHMVNSKRYAAEMHVVHFNSDKYPNISMAVDKSDGLAVLAVLIEVGDFNPAFEKFLRFIGGIKYKGQKVKVPGFNIRTLLPARLDQYYRYDGSLTTPPCYPSVLWTVFSNPVQISWRQFQAFATAISSSYAQDSHSHMPLNGNYRKPQLIDSRVVLVSFKEGRGLHGTLTVANSKMRKQLIQQLLVGDLADLADEQLYQLLPGGSERLNAGKKKSQQSHTPFKSRQQTWKASLRRKSQTSVGKPGLAEETLCYVSLEQSLFHKLKQSHSGNHLAQSLRDLVFPKLNLRSYLDCRSDLDLATIRYILRGRPTDEAWELDQSLTKALMIQRKTAAATKPSVPTEEYDGPSRPAVLEKSKNQVDLHPWLLPMEWED
ncbi:carbonic anhydrase 12 [Genypterus blacodes]|uniref:carbonic anhydrase 12 n=1 Tax=Genypterus blacodes TaxID=154954 RepID=UPI003F75A23F